jgi:amino acid adenylation domain-containing protein
VVNLYGPTETTLVKCFYQVPDELLPGIQPAGWPLPQTQALVLADNDRLCGIGEIGEIVLRTPFRSLGYINAPAEQQRFVQNPFREDEGDVLYYTGDRGRYRPDGLLEILGRGDDQVKVHGVRVELGEVTAMLAQHPAVQACTVVARKNVSAQTALVAYVVVAALQNVTTSVLRVYLSQHLPTAMVPTAFVFLDALPLLPNGKVDRRALPAPEPTHLELEQAYSAPRTPVEEMVAEIWADILGLERVGIHDNFFALGGHSLLATQVLSRIRKVLRVELPVRCLFETPTAAGLAAYIETLRQTAPALPRPAPLPVARNCLLPLSFAQQRLWFLDQLEPQSPLYNMPRAVRLRGPLHVEALQRALSAIVSRHEALRTTFVAVAGSPVQVIAAPCAVALSINDLSACSAAEQEAEVQRLLEQEGQRPFDLTTDVMLRASLLRLGAAEHILLLVTHHIAADGWSMGVLWQELSMCYDAFLAGKPPILPGLPIQYADFAVWQRQWLQGEYLETQLVYWKQQLHNVPPMLELPTDRPRPAIQSCRGARQTVQLSKTLSQALKALGQRTGSTLFMTLLAAFKVLLQRYTGQNDIVVGSPIANRTQPEIEGLIGFFVNTLVLRTDLAGNPTFLEVLERVRAVTLGAYAHQDLPFEKLVEELRPERDMSRSPLFQVLFILQNTPGQPLDLPGVTVTNLAVDSGLAKFDLTLSFSEAAEGLTGVVEYNTELFDADTVERLVGHLQTLLEGIVAYPEIPIARLPLLTAAERQQLLVTWNATGTTLPQVMGIHHLFEAQVEQTPDAVAVIADSGQLTYRELNQHANQLAHHLQALGIGPDVLVGLCMERSLEMVIGLLGVLKAGGAYVPLDAAYPQERLAFILRDAQVPVLLTQQPILRKFPAHEAQVVCLDTDWEVIAQQPTASPQSPVTAANLAYVIYTSGSTGTPKGVAITHWNAVALLDWARRQFAPESLAGVLASTSICFDLSVFELFVPLSCGGTVIVAQNLLQLPQLSTVKDVILINTVPSVMSEFLRVHCLPPSVRTVNLAGEPLPTSLVQQTYQHNGIEQVYDLYGPSEDTTYSTCALRSRNGPATIGRPIANAQVYILDSCLTPVPIGIPGELYIGGAGLARGYLHRPELTAEKFLPNPFSDTPGARLYQTGDLARYLPDGAIAFLGRIDDQVKIRGFRIELGEVEAVLSQHPAVREAVVVAREDVPGEKHLVAYVLANQEPGSATSMLRSFLKEKLPEYMVPSLFVILDAFPLTPNGKVDRRALPAPDTSSTRLPGTLVPPRDSLELQLVQMWEEILHLHPLGVTENFFDLGGHSLLAVRLMAQMQRQFGLELPLAALFHGATIEDLARLLRQHTGALLHSPLVRLQPAGTKRPFFCVHPAGGNVFCYVDLARHLGADQPLYGLQHPGLHGEQPAFTRLEEMAEHYIAALRTQQPEGPYLLGGWSMGGMVAFEMAQQLVAQGQEVALLALLDTPARFSEAPPTDGDHAALLSRFAQDLGVFLDTRHFARLTPEAQLAELLAQAKAAYVITGDVGLAQLRQHVQVFIHNVRTLRRYTPKAYPGHVTLLRARKYNVTQDHTLGWGALAAGGVVCHTVPGHHYTMVREPHVQALAQRLRECLAAASLHPNNKA